MEKALLLFSMRTNYCANSFELVDTIEEYDSDVKKISIEVRIKMVPRNNPAKLSSPSRDRNRYEEQENDEEDKNEVSEEGTYIGCNALSASLEKAKANVKIAFYGQTFLVIKQDFYFYQVDEIFPPADQNTGEGNIKFNDGGFQPKGNISFILNGQKYKPINATEKEIEVDIPSIPENFSGYVEIGLILNKNKEIEFKYYIQLIIESIFPLTVLRTGKTLFHILGEGSCIGKGKIGLQS